MNSKRSRDLLDAEERDAWAEYLDATQGLPPERYQELEGWAWARLRQRLRAVERRRRKTVAA